MPAGEVQKLQLHLSLLREEYVRLQRDLADISRKYAILSAESGAGGQAGEADGYVASLVATVADLFRSRQFRSAAGERWEREVGWVRSRWREKWGG